VDPRPDGSAVRWGAENGNAEEMLENAAAGQGASMAPASMAAFYARPDIVWVPLPDTGPPRIELARDPAAAGPLVTGFVGGGPRRARVPPPNGPPAARSSAAVVVR
jgi:hypothetical protein